MVTAEQNVFEWFLSRMFSITASPAQKYVSLGLNDEKFKEKDHWKKVKSYIKRDTIVTSPSDTIIPDVSEVEQWAKGMFADDIDTVTWMCSIDNLRKLHLDASNNTEQKKKWLALCKEFKISVFGKKDGFSTVTPDTIHNWATMSDGQKSIARFVTIDSKKKELRRRLPNSNPFYANIKKT